jgi:hypothetical protein
VIRRAEARKKGLASDRRWFFISDCMQKPVKHETTLTRQSVNHRGVLTALAQRQRQAWRSVNQAPALFLSILECSACSAIGALSCVKGTLQPLFFTVVFSG